MTHLEPIEKVAEDIATALGDKGLSAKAIADVIVCVLTAERAEVEQLKADNVRHFDAGMLVGLRAYAWWRDGGQYVGTLGTPLKRAEFDALAGTYPDLAMKESALEEMQTVRREGGEGEE